MSVFHLGTARVLVVSYLWFQRAASSSKVGHRMANQTSGSLKGHASVGPTICRQQVGSVEPRLEL